MITAIKKQKLGLLLVFCCPMVFALPKTKVTFSVAPDGHTQAQIRNETTESLACYVAIDGFKRKFQLRPKSVTRWFKAKDTRFTYKSFSTWCDYIEIHPEYKKYTIY